MGEVGGGRCLDEESTVLAATDVHCKLILNVRLARNHNAKSMALIFAMSETEAICRTSVGARNRKQGREVEHGGSPGAMAAARGWGAART